MRARVEETVGRGESTPSGHIPFTPRAKKVLELSLREALQFGHNYIGTEHLLLGLIREGEGVAATVLVGLGADLESVRQKVVQLLAGRQGSGVPPELLADPGTRAAVIATAVPYEPGQTTTSPGGELFRAALDRLVLRRFTVSSCRVLLLAESEALRLGTTTVGSEHLLLGLLAEGEGAAAVALGAMGIDLVTARTRPTGRSAAARSAGPRRATFSDLALDALERALAEALTVGRDTVDTARAAAGTRPAGRARPGPDGGRVRVAGHVRGGRPGDRHRGRVRSRRRPRIPRGRAMTRAPCRLDHPACPCHARIR